MPGSTQTNIFSTSNNNNNNNNNNNPGSNNNANTNNNNGNGQQQAVQVNYQVPPAYNYIHPSMIQQSQQGANTQQTGIQQHQQMQGPPIQHQPYPYPPNQFGKF